MQGNALNWLDYDGQTSAQLIALDGRYRTDSLCAALEWAVQTKQIGGGELTDAELVVLAVEAIAREVNHGGYYQFFLNASHAYAPIAAEALELIGCRATAEVTRRALAALGLDDVTAETVQQAMLRRNEHRDEVLEDCDQEFYSLRENMAEHLFAFVKSNAMAFES